MKKNPESCLEVVNPAIFHSNWAGLAVLISRQLLNGSQDFFFSFNILILIYFLNIKPLRSMPVHFCHSIFQLFTLNARLVGSVSRDALNKQG